MYTVRQIKIFYVKVASVFLMLLIDMTRLCPTAQDYAPLLLFRQQKAFSFQLYFIRNSEV